jgi:hypothetical protein
VSGVTETIEKDDYVQGWEYFGREVKQVCGWVGERIEDSEGVHYRIQADDSWKGARGTTIHSHLGEVVKLAPRARGLFTERSPLEIVSVQSISEELGMSPEMAYLMERDHKEEMAYAAVASRGANRDGYIIHPLPVLPTNEDDAEALLLKTLRPAFSFNLESFGNADGYRLTVVNGYGLSTTVESTSYRGLFIHLTAIRDQDFR